MRYLFLDTENASPDCLLTGFLAATDDNFNVLGTYEFALKHEFYLVKPEAMQVNGIDLLAHDAVAKKTTKISAGIRQFIKKHSTVVTCDWEWTAAIDENHADPEYHLNNCIKSEKLVLVGHAVRSDAAAIMSNFPDCQWSKYVSRCVIDTIDLAKAAKCWGLLDTEDIKLGTLADHFGISHKPHIAKEDTYANIAVFKAFKELMTHDKSR